MSNIRKERARAAESGEEAPTLLLVLQGHVDTC